MAIINKPPEVPPKMYMQESIIDWLRYNHKPECIGTEFENDKFIMDVAAIVKGKLWEIEIKTSRADIKKEFDKKQWYGRIEGEKYKHENYRS